MAQIQRTMEAGDSIIGFHGDFLVASVKIDNPTGTWLQIRSQNLTQIYRVPPYVIDWAITLPKKVPSIDILTSASGPAGLTSSTVGDTIEITLYDFAIGTSSGVSLIGLPVSTQFATVTVQADSGGNIDTLITTASNERVKLYSLNIGYASDAIFLPLIPCLVTFIATGYGEFLNLLINDGQPSVSMAFSDGLDLEVGADLQVEGLSPDAVGLQIRVTAVYLIQ